MLDVVERTPLRISLALQISVLSIRLNIKEEYPSVTIEFTRGVSVVEAGWTRIGYFLIDTLTEHLHFSEYWLPSWLTVLFLLYNFPYNLTSRLRSRNVGGSSSRISLILKGIVQLSM